MKKYFLLLFFIVAITTNLTAQNPMVKQWDYRFGGSHYEWLYNFSQTSDKGFILGGGSKSGISGNKTQPLWGSSANGDYWIVKLDSLGNKEWDRDYGGTEDDFITSILQTNDNGYIIGGSSNSGISGNKTQSSWGDYDYWVIKIDSVGNIQWEKDFGGANDDKLQVVKQTNDGGYILAGVSNSGISGNKSEASWGIYDYWIIKIDSLGIKQWDKDFGGNLLEYLYGFDKTLDGGFIIGGFSLSGISGNKTQPSWGAQDFWIVKIDSLGNFLWDKDFGGTGSDLLFDLKHTNDGGFILAGNSNSGIGGNKSQPIWGGQDFWIVKTDSLGNMEWDKDFGGNLDEEVNKITLTIEGGYIISGDSYSQISGNKSENNLGVEQSWIVKTDSLGNLLWDKTLLTLGHDEQSFSFQTKDGCYAFANCTDADSGGYKSQSKWGLYDFWIIKFCDSTSALIPSINLASSDSSFCERHKGILYASE